MATIPSGEQFRSTASNVDLTNRGSSLQKSNNHVYTMQDIIDTVNAGAGESYKVLVGFWQYDQDDLSQDDPTVTILSNTTDETVTGSRISNGYYQFTLSGTGVEGDGYLTSTEVISSGADSRIIAAYVNESGGNVTRIDFSAYAPGDNFTSLDINGEKIYFELRVY